MMNDNKNLLAARKQQNKNQMILGHTDTTNMQRQEYQRQY